MEKHNTEFKIFFLVLFFAGIFLLPKISWAADYFITQDASGNDTGADCANAHSVVWFNTVTNWANPKVSGKIGPGDTVHLCGTINMPLAVRANGNSGNPITVLFQDGAKFSAPTWVAYTGAITINKNYITLDGGTGGIIEATDNGTVAIFGGVKTYNRVLYGVLIDGGSNVTIKNLTIRNIYDRLANSTDCLGTGSGVKFQGNSNNILIDNNTINSMVQDVTGILANTSNITVSNNKLSDSGVAINIAPGNTSSTGENVYIYGNTITGGTKWDGMFDHATCLANGCSASCATNDHYHQDGMHLFSQGDTGWVNNVNIYNNFLQDFGTHSTAHIYVEYHGMQNVKIYNNICVNTGSNYAANGMITVKAADGVKIYNNTLIGAGPNSNIGIYFNESGGHQSQNGDIKNNIISGVRTIMGWAVGTTWTADNNDFFNYSPSYMFYVSDNSFHNLAWWQGQGYDIHGITFNPFLDTNYAPQPGSFAIGAGENLSTIFTIDYLGVSRPQGSAWDIGAYEYVGTLPDTTPPQAPTGVTVN